MSHLIAKWNHLLLMTVFQNINPINHKRNHYPKANCFQRSQMRKIIRLIIQSLRNTATSLELTNMMNKITKDNQPRVPQEDIKNIK
jgi:hypothetical protein